MRLPSGPLDGAQPRDFIVARLVNAGVAVQALGADWYMLAFDQNMVPYVAFVQDGVAWLYWFDTAVNTMVFSSFPGMVTPRLVNDEKRLVESNNSDVILAYVSGNNLCFRAQRERFQTEHVLKTAVGGTLVAVGMNRGNRLQFRVRPTPP